MNLPATFHASATFLLSASYGLLVLFS